MCAEGVSRCGFFFQILKMLGQFLVTDLVKVLHVSWFLLILLALLGVRCV